jgi:hypothetical protein
MAQNIYFIGGSKGGVGKSIVSMAILDRLIEQNKAILFIETDTSNPDVWKSYKDATPNNAMIDLDNKEDWMDMINKLAEYPDSVAVINSAARNLKGVIDFGKLLFRSLEQLNRKFISLWVINHQRDCIELLKEYMKTLPNEKIHVIKNSYFGNERKFDLYNDSKTRELIETNGGKSLTFPDLSSRICDYLYSKRMTISAAAKELSIGDRAELLRWRDEAWTMLGEIIDD